MYQSNSHTSEAFIAAVRSILNLPISWKLKEIRTENMFQGKIKSLNHKKCTCADGSDKVITFPYLFPLFPSEGHSYLGEYSVLPFFYLLSMNDSSAFPVVEIIEMPLIYSELAFSSLDKEKIDSLLAGIGTSFIASYKKVIKDNLNQELIGIRKRVMAKIFELTNSKATIFFSTFTDLPDSVLSSDESGYLLASSETSKNITWSFQSKKILPIKNKSDVYSFTLSCWAFSKQEV